MPDFVPCGNANEFKICIRSALEHCLIEFISLKNEHNIPFIMFLSLSNSRAKSKSCTGYQYKHWFENRKLDEAPIY